MDIKRLFKGRGATDTEYTSMEILEIRGAKIFIGITALTSAIGLVFQALAGHSLRILLPTVFLYTLSVFFAYRLYRRRKRKADIRFYAVAVATIMFLIPVIARFNYGFNIDWLYAAQSEHINWLLMANLIAFQFLYNRRLYIVMIAAVVLNILIFYIVAWYNGVPMPFYTYTDGVVNHGVMSSRELYTLLMICVVAYLSYRNIPEIEQFDLLTKSQAAIIKDQAEDEARKAEEIQSQYEELEAQYEEIEQMNEEMTTAQAEIMEMNDSLIMQKEKLSTTIRSIAQGVIEVDTRFIVRLINDRASSILATPTEKALGKSLLDILKLSSPGNNPINLADRDFLNGNIYYDLYSSALLEFSGETRELALRAAPLRMESGSVYGYVFVIDDITELKKMKEHIVNSSKLESLGIFSGGIAHDINNFFTGMLGCIALARKNLAGPESGAMKYLDDAESTALRARGLAEQLLTFSKGGEPVKRLISVKDMLNLSADFILSGTRVTCRKDIVPDLKEIEADETQVSQVVNNILLNAVQAMSAGGEITISAANRILNPGNVYALPGGEYVEVTIEDQGPGIEEEHLKRMFDPFFTTKSDGSGLGLSVAYSVVKKHGGVISGYNSGNGTVFRFLLPASGNEPEPVERNSIGELSFSGKVLLMDDDEMIRMVGEELLCSFGFEVVSAAEGITAIEKFRKEYEAGGSFRFVILDLTIRGGAGGLETFQEMLKIDPGITGIVSSGYSHDPVMSNYKDYGFAAVLKKPYNFDELRKIIKRISSE